MSLSRQPIGLARFAHLAPLALAVALAVGSFSVHAQTADPANVPVNISIAAQPLAQALNELARQTGLTLMVPPALVAGKTAPAIRDRVSAREALQQLLRGTGLEAFIDGRAVTVRERPAGAANAASLPQVSVTAALESPIQGYSAVASTTSSKMELPTLEDPQVVNVVTPRMIEDFQVRSLDDVAKFSSGVVQSNTYGNTEDGLIKRGFGTNTDGSVLRDGARSASQHKFSSTIDHVEILKGPASLLYGALEPGGVVNVVSKRPLSKFQGEVQLSSSSYGGGTAMLDLTGPVNANGLDYRLIVERKSEDYWRNFGTNEHTLIAPSLSWTGDHTKVLLSYEHNDYSQPYDRGTVFINGKPTAADYSKRFDEAWSVAEGYNENASVQIEHRLSPEWSTRFAYNWSHSLYNDSFGRPAAITAAGRLTRRADGNRDVDETIQYLDWNLQGHTQLAGMRHDLVVGIDAERNGETRGDSLRGAANTNFNIFNPVYGNLAAPSNVDAASSGFQSQINSHSVYVKDNWHLTDKWILALGARLQHFSHFYGIGRPFKVGTDNSMNTFLPFLGVVYKLNDQVSFYGNYSKSFVPNRADANTGQGFDPEQGRSYELGAKFQLHSGVGMSVALYDIRKKNLVVSETDALTGLSVSRALGEAGSRGLEVDANATLSDRWDVIGTYAYTDAKVLQDPATQGNRLSNVPRNALGLYLSHRLDNPAGWGQWNIGGGARYVGKREGDDENTFTIAGYTVADMFVRWDTQLMGQKTRLQFNVNNLFDKQYYPSSAGAIRVNVGASREFRLSASVAF